ncbi:hypothetical protein ACQVPJ_16275 [Bacillus mycoides]|uniref:hypothetical protein n=1 Tax=Bacillus mycoides TaxID=1405 RepID=UPI003D66233C
MKTLTTQEIKVSRLAGIVTALKVLTADLPEVEQQIEEAIADADYLLLQELPALYDELTDDIIKEAISELLAAEDEQLNATCELDMLDKATEEEAQQITRRVNLSCDRLVQAWDDFLEEYDGYCTATIQGTRRVISK